MRKLLSVILLCCLLVYMGGYHLVYSLHKQELKNEMRAWLSVHAGVQIGDRFHFVLDKQNISDPFFTWEEQDHEFSYQGELYDVVTITYEKNSVTITALKDGRENELESQLAKLNSSTQGKNTQKALVKFFPVYIHDTDQSLTIPESNLLSCSTGLYDGPADPLLAVIAPPPRC